MKQLHKNILKPLLCLSLVFPTFLPAADLTLSYYCISNSSNCSTGENQLFTEVTDLGEINGTHQVQFDFYNLGDETSSITAVYFDDGTLLGISQIIDADENSGHPGVDFSLGATPPVLPGGNSINPSFDATAVFSADADNPGPKWGINPSEQLGIIFELKSNGTFSDIADELENGQLRLGLRVTGFESGSGASFINNPVPLPAAIWLFISGLASISFLSSSRFL